MFKNYYSYAGLLLNLLSYQDGIERGLKLCRYVKDKVLWTAFSAICINYRDILIAETAVASIDEVDKVNFIEKILKMKDKNYNENLPKLLCFDWGHHLTLKVISYSHE